MPPVGGSLGGALAGSYGIDDSTARVAELLQAAFETEALQSYPVSMRRRQPPPPPKPCPHFPHFSKMGGKRRKMGKKWARNGARWPVASLGSAARSQVATGTAANALAVACSTASYQVRPSLYYPHFPRFLLIGSRVFLAFWPCSLDSRRPDGENGRKTGERRVRNGREMCKTELALKSTALIHALAHLAGAVRHTRRPPVRGRVRRS